MQAELARMPAIGLPGRSAAGARLRLAAGSAAEPRAAQVSSRHGVQVSPSGNSQAFPLGCRQLSQPERYARIGWLGKPYRTPRHQHRR